MVKYGLTPAQAIRSATSDAAELLGRVQGRRPGRARACFADLIAVAGDPLEDVTGAGEGRLRDERWHGRQGRDLFGER